MFINDIDNNILNYGVSFLGVYQEKYEKRELYQDINIYLGWNQTKKTTETAVHVTHAIINTWKISHNIFERGLGFVDMLFF